MDYDGITRPSRSRRSRTAPTGARLERPEAFEHGERDSVPLAKDLGRLQDVGVLEDSRRPERARTASFSGFRSSAGSVSWTGPASRAAADHRLAAAPEAGRGPLPSALHRDAARSGLYAGYSGLAAPRSACAKEGSPVASLFGVRRIVTCL